MTDEIVFHRIGYYGAHNWAQVLGMTIAGALCFTAGRSLDRRTGKIMIDPKIGKEKLIGGQHTFCYIPMHWWGVISPLLGVLILIYGMSDRRVRFTRSVRRQ